MSINVTKHPEEIIVIKPATYDITISFTQEQLDWFVSFLGEIAGNYPDRSNAITPLREVTDPIWYSLQEYTKEKVNVTKFNYVKRRGEEDEDKSTV